MTVCTWKGVCSSVFTLQKLQTFSSLSFSCWLSAFYATKTTITRTTATAIAIWKQETRKGNYDAIRLTHTLLLLCCFSSYSSASVPNIPHLSPHCHRQICVIFMFGGCFRRILRGRTKWRRSEWMYTRSYVHPFICSMNPHTYICKHFRVLHEYIIVILDSTIQVCTASINTVLN